MWFLIKGSFWTTATLVALSFLGSQPENVTDAAPRMEVSDAIGAGIEAYGYISGLCAEKPEVCAKGADAFVAIQHRARDGARVAYQIIDRHMADKTEAAATEAGHEDTLTTGTTGTTVTIVPLPQAKPAR